VRWNIRNIKGGRDLSMGRESTSKEKRRKECENNKNSGGGSR
jgi:hypothetical protein